jgi:hypothetical protein
MDNLLKSYDENETQALELKKLKKEFETEKKYREEIEKVLIDKADTPTKQVEK